MFTDGNYESAESLQTKHRFTALATRNDQQASRHSWNPRGNPSETASKKKKSRKAVTKVLPQTKKPRFSGGIFRKAEPLFALFRYIVEGSKKSEGFFHYSSSILESCFLVVTGTASQFGEVYFPLRPLCIFDYNENCCQNDVTASSRPLRVEGLDFFNG